MSDVIVKDSKIQGKGIFANRDFKKGEQVLKWSSCSDELTKEEVAKLSEEKKKLVSYLGDGKYVMFKPPGRYMNHSCDANTTAIDGYDVAIKDIKKGDEITCNYVGEKVPFLKMKCNCGGKNCKKVICGELKE